MHPSRRFPLVFLAALACGLASGPRAEARAASLSAPERATVGSTVEVRWEGPGAQYDPIHLVTPDAPDDAPALTATKILSGRNPVPLVMPEHPGRYEMRYRSGGAVIARRAIEVVDVPTRLDAPERARSGASIAVEWQGPGNSYERVALHAAGAADDAKPVAQATVLGRSPVTLHLPEAPGDYELRYETRTARRILATRPITVEAVEASLEAPETAVAARPLEVGWAGPGNDYDAIALFAEGAADDARPLVSASILGGRNPVLLRLPDVAGPHELRYRTARGGAVLARRAIRIEPAGRLAVVFEREGATGGAGTSDTGVGAVEIVLDASGSMLKREGEARRIEIARSVLEELVREHLGDDRQLALRVFGHRQANACRTDLEIPLAPLDREAVVERVRGIQAMNLARTPIADSLAKVPADLAGASGPKSLILITDGEETCDGDPAAVIRELRASGLDVRLSVVGFAIDDPELKREFESWAELGGGGYFDARSAEELIASLRTVISGPFVVLDAAGAVAAEGVIGGAEVVLPAGRYRVETRTRPPRVREHVEVLPGERTEVAF